MYLQATPMYMYAAAAAAAAGGGSVGTDGGAAAAAAASSAYGPPQQQQASFFDASVLPASGMPQLRDGRLSSASSSSAASVSSSPSPFYQQQQQLQLPGVVVNATASAAAAITSMPAEAAATLFVLNIPDDASEREMSHIFRPYSGFRYVRILTKPHNRGGKLRFAFVQFSSKEEACVALSGTHGYVVDPGDRDARGLVVEFSHSVPGLKTSGSGAGGGGKSGGPRGSSGGAGADVGPSPYGRAGIAWSGDPSPVITEPLPGWR